MLKCKLKITVVLFGAILVLGACVTKEPYVHNAIEKLAHSGREAIYAFAEGDDQRMLLMGLKRFTKYAQPINPMKSRRDIADRLISDGGWKL